MLSKCQPVPSAKVYRQRYDAAHESHHHSHAARTAGARATALTPRWLQAGVEQTPEDLHAVRKTGAWSCEIRVRVDDVHATRAHCRKPIPTFTVGEQGQSLSGSFL